MARIGVEVDMTSSDVSDPYFRAAAAALATRPDLVETRALSEALDRHYGLSGEVAVLSSEVEHTAEVAIADGRRFILKTSSQSMAIESFRFQSSIIADLEAASGFMAPRIMQTGSGTLMFEEPGMAGYLQTRLSGTPLRETSLSADVLFRTGQALGAMDTALGRSDVPGKDRPVLWHVRCWPQLEEFAKYLPRGSVADLVGRAMREYGESSEPRLRDLTWQITHNDPSPHNTLLMDGGIAFIDFGDGGWGPRIQDLAIAASHFVTNRSFALGGAEHLVAGYASVSPLSPLEAQLLVGLMKARQSALILINHWRAAVFPADATYIKKNVARAENGLAILSLLSAQAAEAAVLGAMSDVPHFLQG